MNCADGSGKMEEKLKQLVEQYNEIEKKIMKEIKKLPRNGRGCNCDNRIMFVTTEIGEFGVETTEVCLNCGGYEL